jgi:pyrimidine operon attenuation protein / uracil phosphoribosyltransferase
MQEQIEKVKILGGGAMTAKIRRMAYQVYEKNFAEKALVLCGIGPRGAFLAGLLHDILREISSLDVEVLHLHKPVADTPMAWAQEAAAAVTHGKVAIIVDDVLYSGLTILNAMTLLLPHHPAKIQVAVLIDRGHRHYPISHDFVGMVLATSLRQYVSVEVDEDQHSAAVYLF